MSMIVHLLRSHASRRRQRKEAKEQWERAGLSRRAIHSRNYRVILAAILILIGAIAFVEVVLVPGKMIRRNLPQVASTKPAVPDGPQLPELPTWLKTEEQKTAIRQQELERLEATLRSTHLKLGNACLALGNARDSLEAYSENKLHVVPAQHNTATVAPSMVDVLANEPTAQVAWAKILEASNHANVQLQDAREHLSLVGARFAAGSFLAEDDQAMAARIQQLDQSRADLDSAHSLVDHIVTLQRARAALAHQAALDTNPGAQK